MKMGCVVPQTSALIGALVPVHNPDAGVFEHPELLLRARVPPFVTSRLGGTATKQPIITGGGGMQIVTERVAGLDAHKKTVTGCARTPDERAGKTGQQ